MVYKTKSINKIKKDKNEKRLNKNGIVFLRDYMLNIKQKLPLT